MLPTQTTSTFVPIFSTASVPVRLCSPMHRHTVSWLSGSRRMKRGPWCESTWILTPPDITQTFHIWSKVVRLYRHLSRLIYDGAGSRSKNSEHSLKKNANCQKDIYSTLNRVFLLLTIHIHVSSYESQHYTPTGTRTYGRNNDQLHLSQTRTTTDTPDRTDKIERICSPPSNTTRMSASSNSLRTSRPKATPTTLARKSHNSSTHCKPPSSPSKPARTMTPSWAPCSTTSAVSFQLPRNCPP